MVVSCCGCSRYMRRGECIVVFLIPSQVSAVDEACLGVRVKAIVGEGVGQGRLSWPVAQSAPDQTQLIGAYCVTRLSQNRDATSTAGHLAFDISISAADNIRQSQSIIKSRSFILYPLYPRWKTLPKKFTKSSAYCTRSMPQNVRRR